MCYWLALLQAQNKGIEALIAYAYADGDRETAITLMREATEVEARVGKAPVTPGHVLPACELLGYLLMATGDADGATEAYQSVLAPAPNRKRSILGLEKATAQSAKAENLFPSKSHSDPPHRTTTRSNRAFQRVQRIRVLSAVPTSKLIAILRLQLKSEIRAATATFEDRAQGRLRAVKFRRSRTPPSHTAALLD